MTTEARPLSPEILEEFRAALKTAGSPLGHSIDPGLSDEQIDQLAADLGVDVPPELRTLWRWGSPSPAAAKREGGWDINPSFELWPPAVAVKVTGKYRSYISGISRYITFAGPPQGGCLLVLGDQTEPTCQVIYALIDDPDKLSAAPSLGTLFQLWTDQLTGGHYRFVGDEWETLDGPTPWITEPS